MTPDLLLVKPTNTTKQAPEPLKAYIGMGLSLKIDQRNINFDKLQGVKITVINQTNRPLVINGNKAKAVVGNNNYVAAAVTVLQQAVLPPHGLEHAIAAIGTVIIPAAVTVGAVPTVKDIIENSKPVLDRYGPDEQRRSVEASRFGRRILWPQEKTQGIIYFQTDDDLDNARIEVPASTLFDIPDSCILTSTP